MIQDPILQRVFAPDTRNSEYDDLYRRLFRFAHRIIMDIEGAKDIASESMVTIWTRGVAFENMTHFDAFAHTVTKNYCIDFLRKRKLKQQAAIYFFRNSKASENVIEGRYDKNELVVLVCENIEYLPDRMKEVMKLTYFEGLSRKEIAAKLNISENTVRNTNAQALKTLRKAMATVVGTATIKFNRSSKMIRHARHYSKKKRISQTTIR
jgi:RNA polymerase sigma factor (sigma-70 family)